MGNIKCTSTYHITVYLRIYRDFFNLFNSSSGEFNRLVILRCLRLGADPLSPPPSDEDTGWAPPPPPSMGYLD
jgi:hypothetical protein